MKFQRRIINEQVAVRLDAARREFETWRQSRTGRARIPENLWTIAAELARECGVFRTARELHVDYSALKNRLNATESRNVRSRPKTADFVEIVPYPAASYSECTVEIERGRGTKIRIHLKSREAPDLGAIGNAFLKPRP